MKKALLIAVALILAVGFIACQDEFGGIRNTGESKILEPMGAGSSPYFPYEEGKTWNYETITNDEIDYPDDFPMEDTSWTDTFTYVSEVIRETELTGSNPLPVWEIRTISSEGPPAFSYSHVGQDSAYIYDEISDSETGTVFPSIPELGDAWEIYTVADSADTHRTYYNVIEDDVEANGYTDCLKIEVMPEWVEDFDEYENFQYWAWDEGVVMTTLWMMMKIPAVEDTTIYTFEGETRLIKGPGIEE
ncbi:hypothetical protein CEE36_09715 [candidate division TA06 bacterium B3_TA06]|uniref:Lipoprotein n=1 Tax=candidate division TA06 bacterium B3_TA06 TaxID=2012487 RepID=A0A532UZ69_UNCT6|nr:MAG: hypothetical protein CEE36_09715 [candidate division TA06 bacterium B3_TA06]